MLNGSLCQLHESGNKCECDDGQEIAFRLLSQLESNGLLTPVMQLHQQ